MTRFVYTAWFRDSRMPIDDQDYEWPACFVVEASTLEDALAWGNRLAHSFAGRHPSESFLSSDVEPALPDDSSTAALPFVAFGVEASDAEIGW